MVIRNNGAIQKLQNRSDQEMLQATINAGMEERNRIYNNLHDRVNPLLRTVMRNLQFHQNRVIGKQKITSEELEMDIMAIQTALSDIKSGIHDIVPTYLTNFGLLKSLEDCLNNQALINGIRTRIQIEPSAEEINIPDGNRLINCYSMVTAIIDNIFQHTRCRYVEMSIVKIKNKLNIRFTHDGTGITNSQAAELRKLDEKTGLKSSMVRAIMLKATIDYQVNDESHIDISIPL